MLPFAITLLFGLTSIPEVAIDIHVGSGAVIDAGDRYTVSYSVKNSKGKDLADSNLRGLPFSKELGDRHDGYFDHWIRGMAVGGMREIFIDGSNMPASLKDVLPAKTDVVVVLRLVAVKKPRRR